MRYFLTLKVVDRGSDAQLQMGEKYILNYKAAKGLTKLLLVII